MKLAEWARERAFRRDEDGCLIWRGSQHNRGYPTVRIGGRQRLVQRALLSIIKGRPLLPSERSTTTCGKPLCCSCLCIATPSMVGKRSIARNDWTKAHGRRLKISRSKQSRWTDDQVADMRNRRAAGERVADIADVYGTKPANLCHILSYRSRVLHLPAAVQFALRRT